MQRFAYMLNVNRVNSPVKFGRMTRAQHEVCTDISEDWGPYVRTSKQVIHHLILK